MIDKSNSVEDLNQVDKILNAISKSGGVKILKALVNCERTQKELSKLIKADKSIINRRLKEFYHLGLVNERFDHEERVLKYSLTEKGKNVLKGVLAFENHLKRHKGAEK